MSTKIQIVKRLDAIKNFIELEDEEMVHLQIERLKKENNPELADIIALLEADEYESLHEAIDKYVLDFKSAELTEHQKKIFDEILLALDMVMETYDYDDPDASECFLSLSGSAGVGKTFVTSKLVKEFLEKGYKVVLTTPTHKSLSVAKYMINSAGLTGISTRTLHSFLNIELDHDYLAGTKTFKRNRKKRAMDLEKDIDVVIVDESSMVSQQLLDFLIEDHQQKRMKAVLFIGDQYQLPPVDETENAVVDLPKQFALTEIVRQAKDSYIKLMANELKECIKNQAFKPLLEIVNRNKYPLIKTYFDEAEFLDDFTKNANWHEQNNMLLSFSNADVDNQNRYVRNRYWSQKGVESSDWLLPDDMLVAGDNSCKIMNSELIKVHGCKKTFNPTININEWSFIDSRGRGCKLVDPDFVGIYNDYVQELAKKAKQFNKFEHPEERKRAWRHYFAVKEAYGEFKYHFASTIHKSQGSTYQVSYINMKGIIYCAENLDKDMAYRMLYVAVTRASKDLVFLF